MTTYQTESDIVITWGFNQVSDSLYKRDSSIAEELWSPLNRDDIVILDKSTNQVETYSIDWSIFGK
jgi:hypothetical protein